MRTLQKTALLLAVLCAFTVGALTIAWRIHTTRSQADLEQVLAETDRVDPGWRLEQIEASHPAAAVTNGTTDLLLLRQAAESLPRLPWPYWSFPEYAKDTTAGHYARRAMTASLGSASRPHLFNPEQDRVVRSELARAQAALKYLRQLPMAANEQVTLTSPAREILSNGQDYTLYSMLEFDARLEALDGHIHEAVNDVLAVLRIGQITQDAPDLRTQVHAQGSLSFRAAGMLRQVLALGEATEADLMRLQHEFEQAASVPRILVGIRGERARVDAILEQLQNGTMPLATACDELGKIEICDLHSRLDTKHRIQLYLNVQEERAAFLRSCLPVMEFARLTPEARAQALSQRSPMLDPAGTGSEGLLVCLSPYIYTKSRRDLFETDLRNQAALQAACCTIAVERFRMKQGRWPQKPDELVPQFLPEVPSELKAPSMGMKIRNDGNFQVGDMLLYEPNQRRQPALPWTFSPEKIHTADKLEE